MKEAIQFMKANLSKTYFSVENDFDIDRRALRDRLEGTQNIRAHIGKKSFLSPLLVLRYRKMEARSICLRTNT